MVNGNKSDEKGTHNILQRSLSANIVPREIHGHKLFPKSVKRIRYFSWQLGVAVKLYIDILETPTSNIGWVTDFPDWRLSCRSTVLPDWKIVGLIYFQAKIVSFIILIKSHI
jgi:hypothetical protein